MSKTLLSLFVFLSTFAFSQEKLTLAGNHFDEALMQKLVRLFQPTTLVETGTYQGETAMLASRYFRQVHTIELSPDLYYQAKQRLKKYRNVHCYGGSSGAILTKLSAKRCGKILFWLDAHFSGGNTAKGTSNTALREEILAIKNLGLKDSIILIDDIRACQGAPEEVNYYGGWPTMPELKEMLLEINPDYQFWVLGDMAIAYPKHHNVEVSKLVEACTLSRLSPVNSPIDHALIEKEMELIHAGNEEEADAIDKLYQNFVTDETAEQTYHYMLWKGLVSWGRGDLRTAAHCFQQTVNAGYGHQRVLGYLAMVQKRR